jgi:hypothetical protein
MPRTDSFEPETLGHGEIDRDRARRSKQEVARQSAHAQGETDVHYGKKFAETEAILKARAEERAAHEAEDEAARAEPDMHLGSTEEQVTPSPGPPSTGAVASEAGMPGMAREGEGRRSARRVRRKAERSTRGGEAPPLGAMPAEELPPTFEQTLAETPGELIDAFRDQVIRSVRGVGEAARQLGSAGREVAGLPVQALKLAIRVGRSWLGRSPRRA